jgi:uncharacterized protein
MPTERGARPWGLAATAGFATLIAIVFVSAQLATEAVFLRLEGANATGLLGQDYFGLLLSVATVVAVPAGLCLTLLLAAARKGSSVKRYLGLNPVSVRGLERWVVYLLLFIIGFHVVEALLGRPFVTEFQIRAFQTAYSLPLLLFAIVVAAPLFEEVFFRGFIFAGVTYSRLGAVGAVVSTSALWSVMHLQYAPVEIGMIFVGGLLLGYARWKADSLYVPLGLHALWNLSAAVETIIYLA